MPDHEEPQFALTAAQRSRLLPDIDVDALQRFLHMVATNDEERISFLRWFSKSEQPNVSFQLVGAVNADPIIQTLLDEIWAPTWESRGLEAIEAIAESDWSLPGRELARARLTAKKRPPSVE